MTDEPPPPWIVVPGLGPEDPVRQGVAEAYIDLQWLPFWRSLTPALKCVYLDRWQTSSAWREAIHDRYEADAAALARAARDHANSEAAREQRHRRRSPRFRNASNARRPADRRRRVLLAGLLTLPVLLLIGKMVENARA